MSASTSGADGDAPVRAESDKMRGYLPHYMSRLMNLLNMRLSESLRPRGITMQYFRIMQIIDARKIGAAAIGEIAADAIIDQSVVSRVVDRLEAEKLAVRRKRKDNSRIVEVSLTPRGRMVYASVLPFAHAIVDDAVGSLTATEQKQLIDLLRRVFEHVNRPQQPWLELISDRVRPTSAEGRVR